MRCQMFFAKSRRLLTLRNTILLSVILKKVNRIEAVNTV
jgi:hypothetical protein